MVAYGQDRSHSLPLWGDSKSYCRCVVFSIMMLTGCGGGGGGTVKPPLITAPPPVNRIGASEIGNSHALHLISAAHLYDNGRTGSGHEIAVLDTGVDAYHDELVSRVIGGGDWQGTIQGLTDPNGHGTHVASIAAAARDGVGMQGIAPDAEIISYRILNQFGFFSSRTGNEMLPPIMADIDRRGVKVVNNSWASFYEITDFQGSVIETALDDELTSYRSVATSNGPILVWAAGYGGDSNVSVRGGLPYYFSELEENWLTVVAVELGIVPE